MLGRTRATALAAVVLVLAIGAAVAVAAAPQKITAKGVGKVTLGASYASLHAKHLVGGLSRGCPLAGTQARSAKLNAPLKGFVDLSNPPNRKVTHIIVRGGATARGVGIGATIAQIKAKFPKAKVDHSTEHMFGVTIVRIPRKGGGPFEFEVPTKTHKTAAIGIPIIPFCE